MPHAAVDVITKALKDELMMIVSKLDMSINKIEYCDVENRSGYPSTVRKNLDNIASEEMLRIKSLTTRGMDVLTALRIYEEIPESARPHVKYLTAESPERKMGIIRQIVKSLKNPASTVQDVRNVEMFVIAAELWIIGNAYKAL